MHAIWGGTVYGEPRIILGHRNGNSDLLSCTYDMSTKKYSMEKWDVNVGPANVLCYTNHDKEWLVSANRETDEIAFYELEKER